MLGQIGKYALPIGVVSFGFPECPLGRLRPDSTRSASFKCVTPDPSANDTGPPMSGGDGKIGLHRPITVSRVQISVADPTRHDFHQGLPRPRRRHRKLSQHEWLAEFFNDCCVHHFRDWQTTSSLDL